MYQHELPIPPVDPESLRVTWALPCAPAALADPDRELVRRWLVLHGIVPRRVRVTSAGMQGIGADLAIVSHPLLGDLIVFAQYEVDAAGAKRIDPLTRLHAVRIAAQPVGMPPPPAVQARGRDHAAVWRLRLPSAALRSGA